jgi:nitroimidazol reductase NimA-like FMN-containing flavoprotein (pyridoxamine 5'-phosphate oxidase superfamily)
VKPLTDAVKQFIDQAHVCRIATVRAGGEPHVIPVCPVFDGDAVFVDLGPRSTTGIALRDNPRITVLFDVYDDDWTRLRKVILRCTAERLTGAAQDAAWDLIRAKYPQYTTVNWRPRMTMALRIDDWLSEGVE